jgi:hypothetical protein
MAWRLPKLLQPVKIVALRIRNVAGLMLDVCQSRRCEQIDRRPPPAFTKIGMGEMRQ